MIKIDEKELIEDFVYYVDYNSLIMCAGAKLEKDLDTPFVSLFNTDYGIRADFNDKNICNYRDNAKYVIRNELVVAVVNKLDRLIVSKILNLDIDSLDLIFMREHKRYLTFRIPGIKREYTIGGGWEDISIELKNLMIWTSNSCGFGYTSIHCTVDIGFIINKMINFHISYKDL